ncbi:hypothetical protein [Nocardia abscessus]|uniref:hypothetical protein n=1 Tax=Nocardia abscessus TaxID=120957 RepID=UPI002454D6F4|nr:hypothetical protein [Nocardia abscessus]
MDSKRTGRKVVDPGRFDPDTPKRRTSQQSHQWLLARIQTPVARERALTLRTAAATVALMLAAAVALAGSIAAIPYALPALISEFSDGCKKLSNSDVIRVLGAGAKVDGFNYRPQPSVAPDPGTDRNVLAGGDICARYVSGWKVGDRRGNSMVFARTQTGSDATAVFRRERENALNRDSQDAQTLRTFFLSDTRFGDEAFCTVTKDADDPAHGVLVRFGDKVVYVDVPTLGNLTDRGNCDRARRLANELR